MPCILVRPGERHYRVFTDLCRAVDARGDVVADAYHAALPIELGREWVTADAGSLGFPDCGGAIRSTQPLRRPRNPADGRDQRAARGDLGHELVPLGGADGYGNSYFSVKPPRIVPMQLVRAVGGRRDFRANESRPFR